MKIITNTFGNKSNDKILQLKLNKMYFNKSKINDLKKNLCFSKYLKRRFPNLKHRLPKNVLRIWTAIKKKKQIIDPLSIFRSE